MKKLLQRILKKLAQMVLARYKPLIIGITGSVGKSSAKEAIYRVVKSQYKARRSIKSYNNELGLPLTILGLETAGKSPFKWLVIFIKALKLILIKSKYPEMLILEMGADRPGDIQYLTDIARPNIGLVTTIGEFPVHLEYFKDVPDLIKEKSALVASLGKQSTAIINYDDPSVRDMRDKISTKAKIITYGFDEKADVRISEYNQIIDEIKKSGITFKLEYKGSIVPVRILKTLGKQQAYAAAAAAAVGLSLGLNLVEISTGLKKYRSLAGRTNLIKGIKNSLLIDDTYNSSPTATMAALDTLAEFSGRKIAVLADMLELGEYTEEAHRQVGAKAAQIVDLLFVVGARAKFMAVEAKKKGLASDKIFEFNEPQVAALKVQEQMKQGDIVLIKGSRAMKMEQVTKEVMAYPEKADKLLVK